MATQVAGLRTTISLDISDFERNQKRVTDLAKSLETRLKRLAKTTVINVRSKSLGQTSQKLNNLNNALEKNKAKVATAQTATRAHGQEISKTTTKIQQETTALQQQGVQMGRVGGLVRQVAGYYAAWFGASSVMRAADDWTMFNNRIRLSTNSAKEFSEVQRLLVDSANANGQSLGASAELFQRVAAAQDNLGLNAVQSAEMVGVVNKAIRIGGSSAQASSAAMLQFSQAMASGTLRGEELNSVLENAPALAKYIADGLNLTTGELKNLASQGLLSSRATMEALQRMTPQIEEDSKKINNTISQSFQILNNKFTEMIGKSGETSGAIRAVSSSIEFLANHIGKISAAVGVLIGFKIGRWLIGTTKEVLAAAGAFAKNALAIVGNTKALNAETAALARNTTAQAANAAAARTAGVARRGQGAVPLINRAGRQSSQVAKVASVGFFTPAIGGLRLGMLGAASTFIGSLTVGITGLEAVINTVMGKSADNWISRMGDGALKTIGILKNDESLGTYLYQRTHEILPSATGNYNEQFRLSGLFFDNYLEQHRKLATQAQEQAVQEKARVDKFGLALRTLEGSAEKYIQTLEEQTAAVGKSKDEIQLETLQRQRKVAQSQGATDKDLKQADDFIQKAVEQQKVLKQKLEEDATRKTLDSLNKQRNAIGKSEEALYRMNLAADGITEANQDRIIQEQRVIQALERQQTLRERVESLNQQALRIGKSEREVKIMDLKDEGYDDAQIKQYLEAFDRVQLLKASENFNQAVDKFSNAGKPNETGDEVRARAKAEFEAQIAKYMQPAKLPTYGGVQDTSLASKIASSNEALAELNRKIIERDEQKRLNALNGVPQVQPPAIEKQNMGEITLNIQNGDSKQLTGKLFGNMDFINKLKNVTKMTVDDMINDKARAMVN